jgi:hypothetical protein
LPRSVINFTLHFRLALRDLGAPLAAVGAMLPDLWRMADRHVHLARGAFSSPGARVRDVLAGIAHHERADRAFHASAAFAAGERRLGEALRGVGAPRLGLFGHIAWEICLDGALVRRENGELLGAIRAATLDATASGDGGRPLTEAARAHHEARGRGPLPDRFEARMDRLLAEVARGDWISGYARGPFVADRIDGIRRSLGFAPFTPAERGAAGALLDEAIDRAAPELDEVLRLVV